MTAESVTARTPRRARATRRLAALLPASGRGRLAGSAAAVVTLGATVSALSALPAGAATLGAATHAHTATHCAAHPSACGFPDATNTGVPAGTHLKRVPSQVSSGKGWHYDPRGFVKVNGNGAVLSGLKITSNVTVTAANVTIKNSQISYRGESSMAISLRHARNVTIKHDTIRGANQGSGRLMVGVKDIYSDSTHTRVLNNDIYYAGTGVQLDQGLIQGNYIHAMGYIAGDHLNGTTSNSGTSQLTIAHNTILNHNTQTDAVSFFQDFGPQGNRVIDNNLLAGGGYTIYGGGKAGRPATNIRITNNVISTTYYPKGGRYGPVAYFSSGNGNVWSGNTWDNTGQTIPSPS
jgi:hypothetical protein